MKNKSQNNGSLNALKLLFWWSSSGVIFGGKTWKRAGNMLRSLCERCLALGRQRTEEQPYSNVSNFCFALCLWNNPGITMQTKFFKTFNGIGKSFIFFAQIHAGNRESWALKVDRRNLQLQVSQ